MNIQLRRRKNSSLCSDSHIKTVTRHHIKVLSTPATSNFTSITERKPIMPATASTPPNMRKISITSRHKEDNPAVEIGPGGTEVKNKTVVTFNTRQHSESETEIGGFKVKRNKRIERPISASEAKLKETISSGIGVVDMGKTMQESFYNYLNNKVTERARLVSAAAKVKKNDEEMRQTLRRKFEDKEKKRVVALSNLLEKKNKKIKEVQTERKEMKERMEQQKEEYNMLNQEKKRNLFAKLENSERRRKEVEGWKVQRTNERNSLTYEKQQSLILKRDQNGVFLMSNLSEIEDKFNQTTDRKKRFLEAKVNKSVKHSMEVEERYKKASSDKDSMQKKFLQRIVGKMVKVRSKSTNQKVVIVKQDGHESDSSEFSSVSKLELVAKRQKEQEDERIKIYNDKQKVITERMEKRRMDLQEYQGEKRDIWDQKRSNIQRNLSFAIRGTDKKLEERLSSYREKINYIKAMKITRKKQLESIDRSSDFGSRITSSVQLEFY